MFRAPGSLVVASICAGIAGFTFGEATGLPVLASFLITVIAVALVAGAVSAARRR